jgi:hypothetical protein
MQDYDPDVRAEAVRAVGLPAIHILELALQDESAPTQDWLGILG